VIEVVADNEKSTPVTVKINHQQQYLTYDDIEGLKVVRESQRHAMEHGLNTWTFRLKPGEQRILRYTVEYNTKPADRN